MGKKSITLVAQNGAIHSAAHVAPRGDFRCRYVDLIAMAIRVFDCGSINDAIEASPQCRAHAHGARLAGAVKGVPPERDLLEPLGCLANGAHLGVRTGIELLRNRIQGTKKSLARFGVNNGCSEGARARRLQRARGEGSDRAHVLKIGDLSGF